MIETAYSVVLVIAIAALWIAPIVINWLKGKKVFAVLAVFAFVGLVPLVIAWVGTVRLAKPGSWWSRRYYDEDKIRRSRERFYEVRS